MARLLIVGSGVVGQATGKDFSKKGHTVSYVDINLQVISELRAKGLNAMLPNRINWDEVDLVMLAVSTPKVNGQIVLDYIEAAAIDIGRGLAKTESYITIVVHSTVPPTTTERRITQILEEFSGKKVGVHFGVAMNPEFLRAVSNEKNLLHSWITVVGASDERTANMIERLYQPFDPLIVRCTPTEAEMVKYVNNVYNTLKISYFNEVHAMYKSLGINSNLGVTVTHRAKSM